LNFVEFGFFAICTLFVLVGGVATVAAPNPIRGAMGLLASILGIAGMYLMLAAEFLAAVQIIVYAGAVVVLFLFVIMLLGPSATSPRDARSALPRYVGAIAFLISGATAMILVLRLGKDSTTTMPPPGPGMGSVERIGAEMFDSAVVPFELAGILLLVAVVGAVAIARGNQPDPTMGETKAPRPKPGLPAAVLAEMPASAGHPSATKEEAHR